MYRLCNLFVLLAAVLFAGCVSDQRSSATRGGSLGKTRQVASHDDVSYWNGDEINGSARVRIDLGEQRAYFFKGDQLAGVARVSTGRPGYRTPSGSFSVLSKDVDHVSGLYGSFVDADGRVVMSDVGVRTHQAPPGTRFSGATMPYFVRFTGGIGMHAGYLPGYPASHGCVRLPKEMASHFFNNVEPGTPVEVAD